jgi:hypothetical protein
MSPTARPTPVRSSTSVTFGRIVRTPAPLRGSTSTPRRQLGEDAGHAGDDVLVAVGEPSIQGAHGVALGSAGEVRLHLRHAEGRVVGGLAEVEAEDDVVGRAVVDARHGGLLEVPGLQARAEGGVDQVAGEVGVVGVVELAEVLRLEDAGRQLPPLLREEGGQESGGRPSRGPPPSATLAERRPRPRTTSRGGRPGC